MTKKSLTIHSENILPIIKRWLYSDKDIFSRELVSNACDAIHKLKILTEQGIAKANPEEFKIEIKIDKDKKTLTFTDTGIGMDAEEVEKYIAQIAFSSAEEFLEKYKSDKEGDQIIGHFGLGFYSAYMVAEKVDIDTLSYKEGAKPVLWSCDGSSEYTLETGTRQTPGTQITLHIEKDSEEYLDEQRLGKTLEHYCAFLPYPVYLGERKINTHSPLWIKAPSECTEEEYLEFYRYLYPMQEEPLFWVHLNVDYPFHLKGILYFPKIRPDFDLKKSTVKLYCNRVFVSDECKDVIPNYLMVLQGVIDSPDIPLNVSRSYLQIDKTVRQLSSHISKKVTDSLTNLYRNEKEKFFKCWDDISMIIKLGALEDEKFYERVKPLLLWKTVGGEWSTVEDYLERNRSKTDDKIIYTKDETHLSHFHDIYKEKNIEILCANGPLDSYLIQFLERKITPARFQRIDAGIDENLVDKSRENTVLDAEGKTEATRVADFIRSKLSNPLVEVEAKSLATTVLPGYIVVDEAQRRMKEYMLSMSPKGDTSMMDQFAKRTFVVNTNSPLISVIQKMNKTHPEIASDLVNQLYDLSLLSQREMDPKSVNDFVARTAKVLEELAKGLANNQ